MVLFQMVFLINSAFLSENKIIIYYSKITLWIKVLIFSHYNAFVMNIMVF